MLNAHIKRTLYYEDTTAGTARFRNFLHTLLDRNEREEDLRGDTFCEHIIAFYNNRFSIEEFSDKCDTRTRQNCSHCRVVEIIYFGEHSVGTTCRGNGWTLHKSRSSSVCVLLCRDIICLRGCGQNEQLLPVTIFCESHARRVCYRMSSLSLSLCENGNNEIQINISIPRHSECLE